MHQYRNLKLANFTPKLQIESATLWILLWLYSQNREDETKHTCNQYRQFLVSNWLILGTWCITEWPFLWIMLTNTTVGLFSQWHKKKWYMSWHCIMCCRERYSGEALLIDNGLAPDCWRIFLYFSLTKFFSLNNAIPKEILGKGTNLNTLLFMPTVQ